MGNTANNNWPYPESTDLVKDGATAIENLADAIDTTLGVYAPSTSGLTLINTTSFTAVASQSVDNVFDSTYSAYKIIFDYTPSTGANITLRFKNVSGAITGSFYNFRGIGFLAGSSSGTADNLFNGQLQTSATLALGLSAKIVQDFNFTSLGVAGRPSYGGTNGSNLGNGHIISTAGGYSDNVTATGIQLITSTGTISGSITIFGYEK
jgi:hypothetical protein